MTMSLHASTPPGLNRLSSAFRALRPHVTVERSLEASREGVRVANLMIDFEWPALTALWSGASTRRSFAFYVVQRRENAMKPRAERL